MSEWGRRRVVGSGGRSSEDSCVLDVGKDRLGCGDDSGNGGIYVLLSSDFEGFRGCREQCAAY